MAFLTRWLGWTRNRTYELAIGAFDDGRYEAAIELFTACINQPPDNATLRLCHFYIGESYAQLGHVALGRGRFEQAAEVFGKAVEQHPRYPDLKFCLALAKRRLGMQAEALGLVTDALEINPRYAKAIMLQGLIWYESGRRDDGIERIRYAASLDPSLNVEPFMQRHEEADHAAALEALETCLLAEANGAASLAQLAQEAKKEGNLREAATHYKKALAEAPNFADLRCRLGEVLLELHEPREAISHLEEALRLNPTYVEARLLLARAFIAAGRSYEAIEAVKKVLESEPDNPEARCLADQIAA